MLPEYESELYPFWHEEQDYDWGKAMLLSLPGEIAAVLIGDEATLKRVRLFDDHIVLEQENPQYRPLVFWGEEMDTIRILGKAVAFTSAL